MKGQKIELRIGGETWEGWHFGPWGRARDWRLCTPTGESFTAEELEELRVLQREVAYLETKNRELTAQLDHTACYLSGDEADRVRAAAAILSRVLAPLRRRAA